MASQQLNLITIGYAKRALEIGSRERLRMQQYASVMGELHVIVFTRRSDGLPSEQKDGNLFLYATNVRTRVGMLWSAYKIGRKILKNNQGKKFVVSSQDPFETSLVGRAVAGGNRATHHVQLHGDSFNPESYRGSLLQRVRVFYGKYVVRKTKCIRVVSERLKKSLVYLGVPINAITVLPITSDLAPFLEVGKVRNYDSNDELSFLYVGRFSPEKNLSMMLDVFAEVIKSNPSIKLTLLGSGPLQMSLENQVNLLDIKRNVRIESWIDNVPEVMAEHDVFCLSSNHEGWGMVLLEAAATGMPVITTDVGCVGEVIKNDENGKVVDVKSHNEYISAIQDYLSDTSLVSEHGKQGHKIAEEFSMSETEYLQKTVEAYTSCQ